MCAVGTGDQGFQCTLQPDPAEWILWIIVLVSLQAGTRGRTCHDFFLNNQLYTRAVSEWVCKLDTAFAKAEK